MHNLHFFFFVVVCFCVVFVFVCLEELRREQVMQSLKFIQFM